MRKKAEDLGVKSSSIAQTGSFFRTVSFQQESTIDTENPENNVLVWREAIEHPTSNKWLVIEISQQPNLTTTGKDAPKFIEKRTPLADSQSLSLDEALESLLIYERTQKKLGFVETGDSKEAYGNEHVEAFALNEDRIPDVLANLHPSFAGHVVTEGIFFPVMLDRAIETASKPRPEKNDYGREVDLTKLFADKAEVEDFNRLIENKIKRSEWTRVVKRLCSVLNYLQNVQERGFQEVSQSQFIGLAKKSVIRGEKDYQESIKETREILKASGVTDTAESRARYESFFQQVQMTFEIAYAKKLYAEFNGSHGDKEIAKALEEHKDYAARELRKIGGSEHDVKRMNAEIIAPFKQFYLYNKYERGSKMGDKINLYQNMYGLNNGAELYYFPETLLDFIADCHDMTKKFDNAIAAEEKRITQKKSPDVSDVKGAEKALTSAARGRTRNPG